MRKIPFPLLLLLTVCGFLTQSCSESDCPLTTTSMARFDFLDSKTHQSVSFTEGVTVAGIVTEGDTLLIDTVFNQAQTYMSVPLSYTDKTTFVMHYSETLRDTIELTHRNVPFVSGIECSPMMFFEVEALRYTTNVLDSIILINPEINNEEKKNFNIYYRTADDE